MKVCGTLKRREEGYISSKEYAIRFYLLLQHSTVYSKVYCAVYRLLCSTITVF